MGASARRCGLPAGAAARAADSFRGHRCDARGATGSGRAWGWTSLLQPMAGQAEGRGELLRAQLKAGVKRAASGPTSPSYCPAACEAAPRSNSPCPAKQLRLQYGEPPPRGRGGARRHTQHPAAAEQATTHLIWRPGAAPSAARRPPGPQLQAQQYGRPPTSRRPRNVQTQTNSRTPSRPDRRPGMHPRNAQQECTHETRPPTPRGYLPPANQHPFSLHPRVGPFGHPYRHATIISNTGQKLSESTAPDPAAEAVVAQPAPVWGVFHAKLAGANQRPLPAITATTGEVGGACATPQGGGSARVATGCALPMPGSTGTAMC